MKTSEMIQSRFLKKEECDPPIVCTIKGCSLEEVGGGDERWVLTFSEPGIKALVLNVTKIRALESSYGNDTDYWMGNRVKLSLDPDVMYAGKRVGGIKLQTAAKKSSTPPPPVDPDFNDEIPF